ncbi:RagB/SusD family nutrient uptake outer membrane protein [Empedobacter falsenii]
MKKYIIPFTIMALLLSSCDNDLLNINPESTKVNSDFYADAAQIEQGLNSVYGTLQYNGQYRLAMLAIGEIPTDNTYCEVPANDSFTYGEFDFFTIQPNNSLIGNIWKDNYIGIQQANIILNRIDNITDMSDMDKSMVKGEVKFLRALMYFNLVRIFGDVPLVTKETTDVNSYFGQGRTSKNEVYDLIKTDLTDAIDLLPVIPAKIGKVTKGAALGILGKVYLTLGEYEKALTYLNQIETLGYYLLDNPNDIFDINNENNNEIIFDVQFASGLNGNSEGSNAFQMFSPSGTVSGAKGHNLPTKEIYNLYSKNDLRRDAYIGITKNNIHFTKKLVKTSNSVEDGGSNVVVLRLADVLLMISECYANKNDFVNANAYLNRIKQRAGLTVVDINNQSELLSEIALERRLELIGEGHRWFDLVRTGNAIEVISNHLAITPGFSTAQIKSHHLLMPIPQNQINTDSSIIQNPGY